jgi:crotonobetainyl-CoA:carnitine CoA-transferase CaiB-like acyl-CoA transferase
LYEAADGWLFLAAHDVGIERCAELADLAAARGEALERGLEARMRTRPVADWVQLLNDAGIGAHRVVPSLVELMTDPVVVARKLAVTRDHEGFGPITTTAPGVRLSRTPMEVGRPAPKPGSDAASVLAEIGMAADLERLVRDRVVAVDGVKAGS